jgi:hypothetical protein
MRRPTPASWSRWYRSFFGGGVGVADFQGNPSARRARQDEARFIARNISRSTPADMIAEGLTVPERIMLFCVASTTDWQKAGITHATARQMLVGGLIDRRIASSFTLTEQGRAALEVLMVRGNEWVTAQRRDRRLRLGKTSAFGGKADEICSL